MSDQYKEFLNEIGGLECNGVHYRPDAEFTSNFGLDNDRYKIINGRMVWGYPGLHLATDRSGATRFKQKYDGVFCPFIFGNSAFYDYGGRDWGSDVLLYSKYNFRFRISHMFPNEIEIIDRLKKGFAIYNDTYIGPAGTYGFSTGRHTHTEIEAWGFNGEWIEECKVLEELLIDRYSSDIINQPYLDDDVIAIYKSAIQTRGWNEDDILKDYKSMLNSKNIYFINKFKAVYVDEKRRKSTLYSSAYLWGF